MNCIRYYIILQLINFIGTWRFYQKAGYKFWEAIFPVYSILIMLKIIHRPIWWIILFFLPVISVVMYGILWIEFISFFYKQTKKEKVLVLITFGLYILYINYTPNLKYRKYFTKINKDTAILESAILATCIHTYFIQPFIVPSSSMERTILIGDFIFVSKLHYGLRLPITPIGVPIFQRAIPILGIGSYLKDIRFSYIRLPLLTKLKKGEIVVFNFPYDYKESSIDRKDFYIKRCIALPGDRLEIKEGKLHINGIKENKVTGKQFSYIVKTKEFPLNKKFIKNIWKFNDIIYLKKEKKNHNKFYLYQIFLTENYAKELNNLKNISLTKYLFTKKDNNLYPKKKEWNLDNYGPLYIPKQGDIINISLKNIYKYKDIIYLFEESSLTKHGIFIYINGKKTNTFYVNKNYFFMLGDNRHNSFDSRYWGFLPEEYIIGKPIFTFLSIDWDRENPLYFIKWKIRYSRIMTFFN